MPDDFAKGSSISYPIFNPRLKFGARYGISEGTSIEANIVLWDGKLTHFSLFGRDTNTWVSRFAPEEENEAFNIHQFRGITRGFGTEVKVIFPAQWKSKARKFFSIDFQRGKANHVYWVEYDRNGSLFGFDPARKYLFDVVSTRVAFTLGKEYLLDNIGKSGMLCFTFGGGLIFNSRQIYTHKLVYLYGSPFSPSLGDYHKQTHLFNAIPHLHFGLTFYIKAKHYYSVNPIDN
jgi:hypothetical protein